MSTHRKTDDHHEPDDPDIAQAMRARRQELGLSVLEMAARAAVSEQTWRNYEAGRTQVRGDKQAGVWEALEWEPPIHVAALDGLRAALRGGATSAGPGGAMPIGPGSFGPGSDGPGSFGPGFDGPGGFGTAFGVPGYDIPDEAYDPFEGLDAEDLAAQAAADLPVPDWDDIPTVLSEVYSQRLARTLGEDAARCFALGTFLFDMSVAEDLEGLASLPRGAHLGQLDETHIGSTLPQLWLTRYDYEFVFQLRGTARDMTLRLTDAGPASAEPLVRTMADAIVLHDIFNLGGVIADSRGAGIDEDRWEAWVDALSGPDQPAHALIAMGLVPPADAPDHFNNWFAPLPAPFIPDWDGARDGSSPTTAPAAPGDATVTPLRRSH
ncbi:helix-turn-helix transcriptional regulator [Actinomyces sp. 565]|uniref:helix-turn-helix domain-containing protein n=1 Tax=Actinomyces sp. 565 TaxID=2057794 RepID=UPI0013A6F99B|nr:helix-turn-helix transcriptional regulator [Actinomyces sp. 565]NDR53069.1 helix-turn-helix transcriptional regulator [Actinomyces sp. 565]